jgi:hypothetical protein
MLNSNANLIVMRSRSLDDWYRTINRIYLDQNFYRDRASVFGHLVEVVGGLSLLGTEKEKPGIDPRTFLPKAIAWWLALCGKMGVRSVEAMLWAKFSYVCPYCRKCPHLNDPCRETKREHRGPDWGALGEIGNANETKKPRTIIEWQRMFYDIYPTPNDPTYATPILRFTEEMGELAEAVRIAQVAPGYFLSEASDVFAWLMNLQNVSHSKRNLAHSQRGNDIADEFALAYPDNCRDCGGLVCTCPPILVGILGRIAHEIPQNFIALIPGALMSTEEARSYFEIGAASITVGRSTLEANVELLRDIHATVTELRFFAVENEELARARSVDFARALAAIEELTSSQRITQDSVDRLSRAVLALPSESRGALMSFLTGLTSSTWAAVLMELLRQTAS